MTSSRRKARIRLILITVLIIVVSIDARRFGGGGGSRRGGGGGGGWFGGGGRNRGSSQTSVHRTPVQTPISHPPSHVPRPAPPPRQPSAPHSPQPHNTHTGSNNAKESSNTFIHGEGGGRPRPVPTGNDHKQPSPPHQPTAPYEPITKVNAGHVQSSVPGHGSSPNAPNPPWANPSMGHPNAGSNTHVSHPVPPSNVPHGGQPGGPWTSVPHPPTHPAGPISAPIIPSHHPTQSNGLPPQNFHPHGAPPAYQPIAPNYQPPPPYPGSHPPGMPMPSAPHIGFGNGAHGGTHLPIGGSNNYRPIGVPSSQPHVGYGQPTIIHNHYNGPPVGTAQNPAGHPMYGQPAYGGAAMGQPFTPGQTLVVLPNQQPASSGRGLGEMFKEALVFSTVNAGVNRIINGPPHHHHYDSSSSQSAPSPGSASSTSTVTNTVIYNNQYGSPNAPGTATPQGQNGQPSSVPASPGSHPSEPINSGGSSPSPSEPINSGGSSPSFPSRTVGAPDPGNSASSSTSDIQYSGDAAGPHHNTGNSHHQGYHQTNAAKNTTTDQAQPAETTPEFYYYISNEELMNLTESLFDKDEIDANQYITLNLQTRSVNPNATDEAPGSLLWVRGEVYETPTIQMMLKIFENYEFDSEKKEITNSQKRRAENLLLNAFLNTNIMNAAMKWLAEKGYIEPDDFEWKDTLRHIWMSKMNGATSGFERIFLAEKYPDKSVLGAQNWIYFNREEKLKHINYLSYVDQQDLGGKAKLVKINFKIDEILKPNTTMLIGTPPELEMALYTICYYARPNDLCVVSLGGTKFNIYTHTFRYFGKDLIDLGLMFV